MFDKSLRSKTYRQFCRRKLNKYRHQFPRISQTCIIGRIIREWQNLSEKEKSQLQRGYTFDESDSSYDVQTTKSTHLQSKKKEQNSKDEFMRKQLKIVKKTHQQIAKERWKNRGQKNKQMQQKLKKARNSIIPKNVCHLPRK